MPRQVLYRKYRSRSFDTVVGQQHITDTIEASLKNDKVAHAYLFVGPRGIGKTSVARILAFEVNDIDYSDSGHIDIIEIDAASNRRIDEIRELRDKIHIAPVEAKYKVYIIDEVHMLTREAFNALLKTLEEPPAHAIFVLATTEAHKIPETITSRTQRFVFRPIDKYSLVKHLDNIAKQEKLEVSQDALELIAEYGDGSFRDSISLLDQMSAHDTTIEADDVERFLGYSSNENIELIIDCVEKANLRGISDQVDSLLRQGRQPYIIATQLVDFLREMEPTKRRLDLIEKLLLIQSSPKPHIALEVELTRSALSYNPREDSEAAKEPEVVVEKIEEVNSPNKEISMPKVDEQPVEENAKQESKDGVEPLEATQWNEILTIIRKDSHPLYSVLRMAEVDANKESLVLKFRFAIHARRFDNKQLISRLREVAADIRPQTPEIVIKIDKNAEPTVTDSIDIIEATNSHDSGDVQMIIDTFGGGEVVEL